MTNINALFFISAAHCYKTRLCLGVFVSLGVHGVVWIWIDIFASCCLAKGIIGSQWWWPEILHARQPANGSPFTLSQALHGRGMRHWPSMQHMHVTHVAMDVHISSWSLPPGLSSELWMEKKNNTNSWVWVSAVVFFFFGIHSFLHDPSTRKATHTGISLKS